MHFKNFITTGVLILSTMTFRSAQASTDADFELDLSPDVAVAKTVSIPAADYFLPMVVNIHAGEVVRFVNNDEDEHTVTGDPVYSSFGYRAINVTLHAKTDSTGPGAVRIRFLRPGTFTYYCRNHAHLVQGQPVNGGAVGAGIAGRPMMGIVIVR